MNSRTREKRIVIILCMVFLVPAAVLLADQPQKMNYQAFLSDPYGKPVADATYSIKFSIYDAATGGTEVWTETQSVTTSSGYFSVDLGSVNALADTVFSDTRWLALKVGTQPEMTPRSLLVPVPYAHHAAKADEVPGKSIGRDKIKDKAIGPAQLDTLAVGRGKIENKAIGKDQIDDKTVGKGHLEDKAVGKAQLDTLAVGRGKIEGKAVGKTQIDDDAVDSLKIEDGSIGFEDIGRNGASDGQVIKWDGLAGAWNAADDLEGAGAASGWEDIGTVVRLDASGDSVCVGPSIPTAKLDVDGDAVMRGSVTTTGPSGSLTIDGETGRISASNGMIDFDDENLITTGTVTIGTSHNNQGSGAFAVGSNHIIEGDYSTIPGGENNTAHSRYAAIGGGQNNTAGNTAGAGPPYPGDHATVGGGEENQALSPHSAVGGGYQNRAGHASTDLNVGRYTTIGGGASNVARAQGTTVGGGGENRAGDVPDSGPPYPGEYATIGGGRNNTAAGSYSVVAGGGGEMPGEGNSASGEHATVGGGASNVASGEHSTVPGGEGNSANGRSSFAGGWLAKAHHDGSIVLSALDTYDPGDSVWTDSSGQIVLRAERGFYLTDQGEQAQHDPNKFMITSTGAYLSDTGVWQSVSDRNLKENFTEVDREELLDEIASLPITRWNFKRDDDGVTHIGPVAQDVYAILGLGNDERVVAATDLAGVALAAIQELHRKTQALERQSEEIEALQKQIDELKELVAKLLQNTNANGR